MVEIPDWPTRFARYVDGCALRMFRRGDFDCLTFTNDAVRIISGKGYCDELIGRYARNGKLLPAANLQALGSADNLLQYIDRKLPRLLTPTAAPRGSLVAFPQETVPYWALGIAFGIGAVVVGKTFGTDWAPLEAAKAAWRVECV